MLAVILGPFVEIGAFVTWTTISDPGGNLFAISASLSFTLFRPF
jgi:hypothetical protein